MDRTNGWRSVFVWWAAIAAVLLVGLGGVTIALIAQSHATSVAVCVNRNLGSRNAPASSDAAAHIAFAKEIQKILHDPKDANPTHVVSEFNGEVDSYVRTLVNDQTIRDEHPLGKCK